jgi:hypothetical protein
MVDQRVNRTLKVAAGMGKGRDKYIGHLAHGEVVLPIPFQKAYPGLILDLKRAFERAGLDFNRYIVGHEHNRINPSTGIPMFDDGDGDGDGDDGSEGSEGMSGGNGVYGDGEGPSVGSGEGPGGSGEGGDGGNIPDPTPPPEPTPPPPPPPKPPTPLTPEVTGIPLTYPDIPPASVTPATPSVNPSIPSVTPATPSVNLPMVDSSKPTPTNPNGFFYSAGSDNTAPAPSLFKGAGAPGEVTATAAPAGVKMAAPDPIMTARAINFAKQGFAEPSGIRGMASPSGMANPFNPTNMATPSAMQGMAGPLDFAKMANPNFNNLPQFANGGIVDAALKKVSSKYTDTGLPLNAMEILSKIARTS